MSGHDIHYLFRELGAKDQRQIEKRFNHILGRHPLYAAWIADGLLMDLRSVLERSQTMFSKGRYWHERNALVPTHGYSKQCWSTYPVRSRTGPNRISSAAMAWGCRTICPAVFQDAISTHIASPKCKNN